MTPPRSGLDDRAVEQLLTGRAGAADADLGQALALVRSLGTAPAPQPSAALAQLLDTGFEPEVVPLRRPVSRRSWAARLGAGLTATAASLLVAGTAQALPPALQDGLADLVGAVTPFELPRSPVPEPAPADVTHPVAPLTPSAPAATPSAAAPTRAAGEDAAEDRTAAEEQEREQQRAAEEAAEEPEPAPHEAWDAEDHAPRPAGPAREDVDEEASEPAEQGAEPEPWQTGGDD